MKKQLKRIVVENMHEDIEKPEVVDTPVGPEVVEAKDVEDYIEDEKKDLEDKHKEDLEALNIKIKESRASLKAKLLNEGIVDDAQKAADEIMATAAEQAEEVVKEAEAEQAAVAQGVLEESRLSLTTSTLKSILDATWEVINMCRDAKTIITANELDRDLLAKIDEIINDETIQVGTLNGLMQNTLPTNEVSEVEVEAPTEMEEVDIDTELPLDGSEEVIAPLDGTEELGDVDDEPDLDIEDIKDTDSEEEVNGEELKDELSDLHDEDEPEPTDNPEEE